MEAAGSGGSSWRGVVELGLIAPDGKSYVYSYSRLTEDLYLAEGLK